LALAIAREIVDRRGEGAYLGNLGSAYQNLGEPRRAIEFYQQALAMVREIGDLIGVARHSYNLAILYFQQGAPGLALAPAQEAARLFKQIGHTQYERRAEALLARIEGREAPQAGPSPAEILRRFAKLIDDVILVARRGHLQAHARLEAAFPDLTAHGWRIAEPVRLIWQGERDPGVLTAGLDENSALIIRAILEKLAAPGPP